MPHDPKPQGIVNGIFADTESLVRDRIEEEDGDGLLGRLLGPFARAHEVISRPTRSVLGFAKAEIEAQRQLTEERGDDLSWGQRIFGAGVPGLASMADPRLRERRKAITTEAGGAYQYFDNLKSSFPGEKFILETVFDPLNLLFVIPPLGVAQAALRAARAGRTAGSIAQRARAARAALPIPKPLIGKESLAQLPSNSQLKAEGFTMNMFRRMANTVRKAESGALPLLAKPLNIVNPSGIVDLARAGDQPTIEMFLHKRLQDSADNVIARDIAPIKVLEQTGIFEPFAKDGNLYVRATRKAAAQAEDVPLGDVMERFGSFNLNEAELGLIKVADELIDAYAGAAVREGVDVPFLIFGKGEHYFPRIVTAIKDIQNHRSWVSGGGVGAKPSFTRTRLHEFVEEAIQNDVKYLGVGSRTPISDILETYMKSMMKTRMDKRLANGLRPMGTLLKERYPVELARRAVHTLNFVRIGKHAVRNLNDAFHGKRLASAEIGTIARFSPELGERLRAVNKLTSMEEMIKAIDPTLERALRSQRISQQRRLQLHDIAQEKTQWLKLQRAKRDTQLLEIKNAADFMLEEAKMVAREAASVRKQAIARVARPLGLAPIPHPAFSGRLFPQEMVDRVVKELNPEVNSLLQNVGDVGNLMRLGSLTLDAGFPLIQGLMVLPRAPITWVKAVKESFMALIDPKVQQAFIANPTNQATLAFFQGRIHLGSNEFTQAIQAGVGQRPGIALRIAERVPLAGATLKHVFGRAQASFETFFDVARVKMAEGFIPMVNSGRANLDEVASFVNKMTGVTSSRGLGVSATQIEVEASAFFLAPRYTRATFALMADAFQGGFRGDQARKSLGAFFGGTAAAYVGMAYALGQEPKLDPRATSDGGDGGRFMTVEIGGQHIGLGSKPYSMIRTLIKMGGDPVNAPYYAKRFLRSGSAPVTGAAADIITGRTFMGEPVGFNIDGFRHIGGRFLPFWVEAIINDTPRPGPAGVGAELAGLRSWPIQVHERRDVVQDDMASFFPVRELTTDQVREMDNQGLDRPTWDILSISQQRKVGLGKTGISDIDSRAEELNGLIEKAKLIQQQRGEESVTAFFQDRESVKTEWEEESKKYALAVTEGRQTPEWFLGQMAQLNNRIAGLNEDIFDPNGDHAEAHDFFKERQRQGDFVPLADVARDEYIAELISTDELEDRDGNYLFENAEQRKRELEQKYGLNIISEIEESFLLGKKTPALWRFWIRDRERLRRYWKLKDDYLRRNPQARSANAAMERARNTGNLRVEQNLKNHSAIRRMNRELTILKQELRRRDPEMDSLLRFWGKTTRFMTREAERRFTLRWSEVG